MGFLYKSWARLSLLLALGILGYLFTFGNTLSPPLFWIWLQFPIYLVHEFEEHVWPGKFKEFINREVFHSKKQDIPMNDANVFWINIFAIWILFPLAAILALTVDIKFGLFLPYFGLLNATTHIIAFLAKRRYNPGLIASAALNYPFGIYTLFVLRDHDELTWTLSWVTLALCLLIHLAIVAFVFLRFLRFKSQERR